MNGWNPRSPLDTRPFRAGTECTIIVVAVALLAVAGCKNQGNPSEGVAGGAPADSQWVEIDGIDFPAGMEQADPEILEAYVFAAKHPEVLRYMPCYCGCENPRFAHENNYDCFIDGIDQSREVPRVSPDAMGFS